MTGCRGLDDAEFALLLTPKHAQRLLAIQDPGQCLNYDGVGCLIYGSVFLCVDCMYMAHQMRFAEQIQYIDMQLLGAPA